jgi:hypothetical protein
MNIVDGVRSHFGGYHCGPPCAASDVAQAEIDLGERLPDDLRELYRSFDGFCGPTSAQFLWPLFGPSGLVEMNRHLRTGAEFPRELVLCSVFFGDPGYGDLWGISSCAPGKIIKWSPSWGADFEVAGDALLDVWIAEKQLYDRLAEEKTAQPGATDNPGDAQ